MEKHTVKMLKFTVVNFFSDQTLWSMGKKNLNTPWALYQLNVMVFWTLGMPVVNKFSPKNFLQKLPEKA